METTILEIDPDLLEVKKKIQGLNWDKIRDTIHEKGYILIPEMIPGTMIETWKKGYDEPLGFRKTVVMERYRFGMGEYKYFDYPLPIALSFIREELYKALMPLANFWMELMKVEIQFPENYSDFMKLCKENGQRLATPLILKYGKGGHNTLHQDLYGKVYFPIQAVFFLSQPGIDFEGGEFVLTRQIPRAQSSVKVIQASKGDLLLFATQFKPEKGIKGYYRVNLKHGVSEVQSGERYTLGLIFHDAIA